MAETGESEANAAAAAGDKDDTLAVDGEGWDGAVFRHYDAGLEITVEVSCRSYVAMPVSDWR